jgi:hypothetical protein
MVTSNTPTPAPPGPAPGLHPAAAAIMAGHAGYMIDVTGANLAALLAALGGKWPDVLAGYVTGSAGVDWPADSWGKLHGHTGLFRYDQTRNLALFGSGAADGGDIERGAGTIGAFIDQARKREARGWYSWGYISQADYESLHGEVKAAGLKQVQYGIANWNDSLAQATAQLGPEVVFVQWASPSSNPRTVVPLTLGRTLADLNVDLNATRPGWFAVQAPAPPPQPPPAGLLVTTHAGALAGRPVTSGDGGKTWH